MSAARQDYQRGIFAKVVIWSLCYRRIQQIAVAETAANSVTPLLLLAVGDYNRLDTSLYFIITYSHAELKSQIKVIHDMKHEFPNTYTYTPFD